MKASQPKAWALKWMHLRIDAAGAVALFILTMAAYLGLLKPAADDRATQAADVIQLTAQRERAVQLRGALETVNRQVASAQQPSAGVLPTMQPAANLNDHLGKLTDLAAALGVQIDGLEPKGTPIETTCLTIVQIGFNGHGSYRSCAALLNALREKAPDTIVCSLDLSSAGNSDQANVSMVLNWYAQPPGALAKQEGP